MWRERKKTNKMQQSDVYYQLLSQHVSRVTAYGVLSWFCCMWLVAVVGRCVVGCEHCEVFTSYKTAPHNRYQSQPAEPAQYSICSNTVFVLLKMGIMMPETCWDRSWLQTSNCCILLVFSISSHFAHDARSQEPKSNWIIVSGEITVSFLESQKCRYIKFEIRLMLWQVLQAVHCTSNGAYVVFFFYVIFLSTPKCYGNGQLGNIRLPLF
jgi:hypothetical protein